VDPVSRETGVEANAALRAGAMGVAGSDIVTVGVSLVTVTGPPLSGSACDESLWWRLGAGGRGNGSDVNVQPRRACGGTYRRYCVRRLQGKDEEEKMAFRLTRQSLQSSPDWGRENSCAGH